MKSKYIQDIESRSSAVERNMRINLTNSRVTILRLSVAVLWCLVACAASFTTLTFFLYLIPALALATFFLVDYFSGFIITVLLSIVLGNTFANRVDPLPMLLVGSIWASAAIRVITRRMQHDDSSTAQLNMSSTDMPGASTPENGLPTMLRGSGLTANFIHDLRTPAALIIGFCNAIFREDRDYPALSPVSRANIEAIFRNAKQLEQLIDSLPAQQKQLSLIEKEPVDPAAFIHESSAIIRDLITARGLTLEIIIDNPLPEIAIQRLYIRQTLLNMLRSVAIPQLGQTTITLRASVRDNALLIIISAPTQAVQQAASDTSWFQSKQLVELHSGRLWADLAKSEISISLPLTPLLPKPEPIIVTTPKLQVLHPSAISSVTIAVVAMDTPIIDLFQQHLPQYQIMSVQNADALRALLTQQSVSAIILVQEDSDQVQAILDISGNTIPIIVCSIPGPQERLRLLRATYLPKPVDYDALSATLISSASSIRNILIVDDNVDNADMLGRMLHSMERHYTSSKAYTGQQALMFLKSQHVDAVILDVFLPDMHGLDLVQQIRNNQRLAELPIIVISAYQTLEFTLPPKVSGKLTVLHGAGIEPSELAADIQVLLERLLTV
jgi:CheY-like chemotaxis protein/signal transduction histidine kinase